MQDLLVVDYWNRQHARTMPVHYNHLLQGGYFSMPSARMGQDGELAIGYASVPPYILWNLRCQLTDRLEISGNYRIFSGVKDPILSPYGFGDLSDKGANVKLGLILPEDSYYTLPGIAVGFEDFLGTRNFRACYVVATQVFEDYDLELSVGYGAQRIRRWFGGVAWVPFRRTCMPLLEPLIVAAEYDATPYGDPCIERHPRGRKRRSHINFGLKYRLWDCIDITAAYIRGRACAATVSGYYNFGYTKGFLPKVECPLPYTAPVDREPLGPRRSLRWLMVELLFALNDQGFTLLEGSLVSEECGAQTLRLRLVNECYREERLVRQRLSYLLASLLPDGLDYVEVILDGEGLPLQEYYIPVAFLRRYGDGCLCEPELAVMVQRREVPCPPPSGTFLPLFTGRLPLFRFTLLPDTSLYFGSSRGKLKGALGLSACFDGFIWQDIYYNATVTYTFFEDIHASKSIDRLNPSQIINVRSDLLRYLRFKGLSCSTAYLQKSWNFHNGCFGRAAVGLFEIEYGGAAAELLYYPVNAPWAVGVEAACLRKRTLRGLGFSDKVRQLCGFVGHYRGFLGSQFFFNAYYDWKVAQLDLRIKAGKFLANDYGVRYEVSRYFPSGLRITFWYTRTNKYDCVNGERYFDKGIAITMPLDIFYAYCSRARWRHGLSAWLRDVGVIAAIGQTLYDTIYESRQ